MSKFKLYAVRIFSLQWETTLAFYRDVVGLEVAFADDEMGWAQFDLGGVYLGLERVDPDDPETAALVGRFAATSMVVADIDETYATLVERGVEFVAPPERQPWGGTLAHMSDPDGNVLTLLGTSAPDEEQAELF